MIERVRGLPQQTQLAIVNREINGLVRYRDDSAAFGALDYWASPLEALRSFGDCEDYAILKYITLAELGFSDRQMRIMIVKDTRRRIGHAVLAVATGNGTFILDNRARVPVEHTRIANYKPYYSLNRSGRWVNLAVRKRKRRLASLTPNLSGNQISRALLPAADKASASTAGNIMPMFPVPTSAAMQSPSELESSAWLAPRDMGFLGNTNVTPLTVSQPASFKVPYL